MKINFWDTDTGDLLNTWSIKPHVPHAIEISPDGSKIAVGSGLELTEESSVLARLAYHCFAIDGKGIDPSYATTFVPLIVIPIVSFLSKETPEEKDKFYSIVSGAKSR